MQWRQRVQCIIFWPAQTRGVNKTYIAFPNRDLPFLLLRSSIPFCSPRSTMLASLTCSIAFMHLRLRISFSPQPASYKFFNKTECKTSQQHKVVQLDEDNIHTAKLLARRGRHDLMRSAETLMLFYKMQTVQQLHPQLFRARLPLPLTAASKISNASALSADCFVASPAVCARSCCSSGLEMLVV